MRFRSLVETLPTGRRRGAIVVGVVVIVGLAWWLLPTFDGSADDTDVALVGDSFLWSAQRQITERVHEDGFSLAWAPQTATWCDAPQAVAEIVREDSPSTVVVSFADEGTCGVSPADLREQVAAAAGSAKLVVVENPAVEATVAVPHSVAVDVSRLIGPAGTLDQGCLWFDLCRPDGRIDVREPDGRLAASGQTRVARMIVTALRS